jgi:hypothetical protein
LDDHPASWGFRFCFWAPKIITDWCGREATEDFNTKGYGHPHSLAAHAMLSDYIVGSLAGK